MQIRDVNRVDWHGLAGFQKGFWSASISRLEVKPQSFDLNVQVWLPSLWSKLCETKDV